MNKHRFLHRIWFFIVSLATLGCCAVQPALAQSQDRPPVAWVNVSVATLWSSPSAPRPSDQPALTRPVHIEKWLAGMTTRQREWLSGHNAIQTQVLYGHKVYILESKGRWNKIAVPGQPSPKNPLGYPGWVPKVQLITSPHYARIKSKRPLAVVDAAPTVWLYNDRGLAARFLRISFNTRLPVLAQHDSAIQVATPAGKPKWLAAKDVSIYDSFADIPYPTAAKLIKTAGMFVGLPYIWGGRSGFAFDCSGFIGSIYQSHGIILPRDASAQAVNPEGIKIDRTDHDLRPGTLIFYAHNRGTGHIYHVGMYIGNGKMVEAYNSATPVRTTQARFGKNYWGAVRVLNVPTTKNPEPAGH